MEVEVILSAQEVFKQTKVNALQKSPDAGMEVCMGSDGNCGRYSSLGVDTVYKVSVNLLAVTESNLCCPSFNISLHAQHSGERLL